MKTNRAGIDFISRWEGLRLNAYQCSAGVWTIGYGHTGDVQKGHRITEHQADSILAVDLDRFERDVIRQTEGVKLTCNQFAALVAFVFNIGPTQFSTSTVRRKLLAGDMRGAAENFYRFKFVKGVENAGLIKRRAAERELFERKCSCC